jgi:hypothetical protein
VTNLSQLEVGFLVVYVGTGFKKKKIIFLLILLFSHVPAAFWWPVFECH